MRKAQSGGNRPWKQNAIAALICIGGVAINMILNEIVLAFELPLYLDTVGTVTVAALGGYLPGIIVGFITNMIKSIQDPSSLYYGVLNVLIAAAAAHIARRGWFRKTSGLVLAALLFTLIGGGLGSVIPWYMEGLTFDSESLSGLLYETGHFSLAASHVLSSLIMDLPDKAITVLLVVLFMRFIPVKFHDYFSFKAWMQNPNSIRAISEEEKKKTDTRRLSLRVKILLILGASLLSVAVIAGAISMNVYHKALSQEHMDLAISTAKLAAGIIDGDRIEEYLFKGEAAEGYTETKKLLQQILDSSEEVSYLYAYQILEDRCRVVFDTDTEDMPGVETGTLIPLDEGVSDLSVVLLNGGLIEPFVTMDSYGHLLTAYEPVYDSGHHAVCYVGADVDMEKLDVSERSFFMELLSVFAAFFILLCSFVMWFTDYNIIYPLKAVTAKVDVNSYIGDSQIKLDRNVKELREIDIHTGDELENLYNSFCRMTLNQAEQMRSIRRLSESTAKMQDGLIITMADMVETRDSDTGAHIQKTAAYVKIIVEGLQRKGYYAEKITSKFISDVVRSAPLHDVGKINISDKILNKPGKLTEEEFEIMKTHTTEGRRIMERAINYVEGDNYLKEARNMAAYHHERWDGKGYPEGLHGEVIPLSARIMAVADVFDALTSPRVYKPAFPLEKALSIIEEGKGTQFDAKCVEVFMESLDEVKAIQRKFHEGV